MAGTRLTSLTRREKLEKGYPLGREGERVTRKPPKTLSPLQAGVKRLKKKIKSKLPKKRGVGETMGAEMRQYDAEQIQEKLRIEKELGVKH